MSIINRLFDEIFGPRLDSRHCHWHIGVTGNENDRESDIAASKLAYETQAIRSGHPHVRDDAPNMTLIELVKESIGRLVGLHGVAEHAEHFAECIANRGVVVYDEDCRGRHWHYTSG
jgi:hypothetical protein